MQDLCSIDIGWYHHQMLVLDENRKPMVSSLRFEESRKGHEHAIALIFFLNALQMVRCMMYSHR